MSTGNSVVPGYVYSQSNVLKVEWDDEVLNERFNFSYTRVLPESQVT